MSKVILNLSLLNIRDSFIENRKFQIFIINNNIIFFNDNFSSLYSFSFSFYSFSSLFYSFIIEYFMFKYFSQRFRCVEIMIFTKPKKTSKIIYMLSVYKFIALFNAINKIIKKIKKNIIRNLI